MKKFVKSVHKKRGIINLKTSTITLEFRNEFWNWDLVCCLRSHNRHAHTVSHECWQPWPARPGPAAAVPAQRVTRDAWSTDSLTHSRCNCRAVCAVPHPQQRKSTQPPWNISRFLNFVCFHYLFWTEWRNQMPKNITHAILPSLWA